MAWPGDQHWSVASQWPWLLLFIGGYALLVILMGAWSRMLARRVATSNFHRSLRRFNQTMFAARLMVPVWFAVGVWVLGWGPLIAGGIGQDLARSVAGVIIGTLPAFAAWMGLWWSQYPADRALREQSLLLDWENELPLHQPPAFRSYFSANFRLQVLFTVVPVLMIVGVRDLMMHVPRWVGLPGNDGRAEPVVELSSSIFAAAVVFLFAPEILRRVLSTVPLPNSPLRRRLEMLCQRAGIKYRQILLWRTENNVGNAAVMGVLPIMRYVLLSDLLLERMTDEEIEAVFAHEVGHIVHRHMAWYGIFFVALLLLILPLQKAVDVLLPSFANASNVWLLMVVFACAGFFLLVFGALSRRCERQADVYAARTMERMKSNPNPAPADLLISPSQLATVGAVIDIAPVLAIQPHSHVGPHGAKIFAAALRRVAAINNIPLTPRAAEIEPRDVKFQLTAIIDTLVDIANHWFHGSITGRMEYLQHLSTDPRLTSRFDRGMVAVYATLLLVLIASVGMTLAICLL